MRLAPAILGFVLAACFHLPASGTPACAESDLELNEFMAGPAQDWDGSGVFSARDDEWVELMNTGSAAIDLVGFLLTDGDSLPRMALDGTLGPGERRMVFGRNAYDWERANGFPAFGLSLANSGDAILLWQVVGPDTMLVDSYTYVSHEAAADRSVGRHVDGGTWLLFDAMNPYLGSTPPMGTGCGPSPSQPNTCDTTPARAVTWGEVKQRYR